MSASVIPFPAAQRRIPSLVMTSGQREHLRAIAVDRKADRLVRAAAVRDLVAATPPGSVSEWFWSMYGLRCGLFAPAGIEA